MSFTAYWPTYDDNPEGGEVMTVDTPEDVETLVARLVSETAGAAKIEHRDRSARQHPFTGEPIPDHLLGAGVWQGYGYLVHTDPDHEPGHPVGDPASPVYHSDQSEYDAGTGIPIETLTEALKEFLATGQRPTCVEWREAR